jgi:hypothetical protein
MDGETLIRTLPPMKERTKRLSQELADNYSRELADSYVDETLDAYHVDETPDR